jgi:hypothetical protein
MRIDDNPPEAVIIGLAKACGFRVAYDRDPNVREPNVDEWTLSAGHGKTHVQIVGTRAAVSAFLVGYSAMQQRALSKLREIGFSHQDMITEAERKLGPHE